MSNTHPFFFLFCKHIHSSYIAVNVGRTCFAEIKMLRRGVHLQEPVQSTHLQEGEQTSSCAEITPINAYRYAKTGRKDDRLYCSVIISHHTRRALGFSSPVSRASMLQGTRSGSKFRFQPKDKNTNLERGSRDHEYA